MITDSVQAALDALADADIGSRPFHAVIIGQSCGEKEDKLDFAAYLHKHAPALPLLLSSNDDWEQIRYQAEQSGIVSFLPLPLFRKSLIQGLEAVLESLSNEKEASAYPDLKGKKLLLVEDNFINQEIALEILGATGAQIDVAENGSQAVERFIASPENGYALILMDVQMPVMNGYQATEQIRGSGRTDAATVPIYAMTANTFAEDIARARSAGMNGHIAKPIDISALMQVLRTALGR